MPRRTVYCYDVFIHALNKKTKTFLTGVGNSCRMSKDWQKMKKARMETDDFSIQSDDIDLT